MLAKLGRRLGCLAITFIFSLLLAGRGLGAEAEPIFSAEDSELAVEPTEVNYYLNTLIGEAEFFADSFYEDYLVTLAGKSVVHFTRVKGKAADFYFYVKQPANLKVIHDIFIQQRSELDEISPKIFPAFLAYQKLAPSYRRKGVYGRVSTIIEKAAQIAIEPVISEHSRDKLDNALYQYLCSNNVRSLNQIRRRRALFKLIIDKFYMLSTTCFYRGWSAIEDAKDYMVRLGEQAKAGGRPFRVKVFACSTGEEVITYAVELLEAGIDDFTILASDINDSSLRFAQNMKYSDASFQQVPLAAQVRLKKHFRLNRRLNLWEPKDAKFFKERIKYINHDILKHLPGDLPEKFAPPYDLVSILNVLLYLDDEAVQAKKDYWKDIVNPRGGILVLHDKVYALMRRSLGDKWAFDNFYIINAWLNIRDVGMSAKEKVAAYHSEYNPNSEISLTRLNHAYMNTGQISKALALCLAHLKRKPFSFIALPAALEHYIALDRLDKAAELIHTIAYIYIYPERMLDSLASLEKDRKERVFLQTLKKKHDEFKEHYHQRPRKYERIFDFTHPASQKWRELRWILKSSAFSDLQGHYYGAKDSANLERISLEGISVVEQVLQRNPRYYTVARFLHAFSSGLIDQYIREEQLDKAASLCQRTRDIFERYFSGVDYVSVSNGLGGVKLREAIILDEREQYPPAFKQAVDAAIGHYGEVLPYDENVGMGTLRVLFRELAHCYLLRGKYHFANHERRQTAADLRKALSYIEKGFKIDPVYGKKLLQLRKELFTLGEAYGISL